jgi:hypothetical protein
VQFIDFRQRHVEAIIALSRALQSLPVGLPLPDPLPAPPEVPLSYLATLSQQIETPSALSFEEQSRLVVELKRGLRDPATFQDSRDLLGRLRARRDLLATIAEEIDEVVVRGPKRQRIDSWVNSRSATASFAVERSFHITGPSWLRTLDARLRQTDGAIIKCRPIAELLSPSDQSVLHRLAMQKVWLHGLLWLIPIITIFTAPVSAMLIRNPLPMLNAIIIGLSLAALGSQSQAPDGFYLLPYLAANVMGGLWTIGIILRARKQLVALR